MRKTSLPVLLYGGVSNTHYHFTGKGEEIHGKSVPEKEKEQGFFGIFAFGFVVLFISEDSIYQNRK